MSVYFITGCSTGIGEAAAIYFARQGHRVYATMRTPDRAGEALKSAMAEDLDIRLLPLDVTDDHSVARGVGTARHESGQIDVLVNNAGVGWLGSVEESPISWLKDTLETNVVGMARMCQAVTPGMREQGGGGTIVNIGSVAGLIASGIQSHYCASKFAVEALSESLAQEVMRFGIRVILIEPGFIKTPILEKALVVPEGSLEGPYGQLTRRRRELFQMGAQIGDAPVVVAEVIDAAMRDPEQKLRYYASENAEPAVAGRRGMTDREWIDMGREMTDEAYAAESAKRFGPAE
jgi:NAD(P)-dependent dehydrogenase (short-subunit alcohol dehydrogenase family)